MEAESTKAGLAAGEAPAVGDFGSGSIISNVMKLALPMLLAQFVGLLYNVVDRMFIGHISQNASDALTGLGISFPIIYLCNAFANLAGQGGSTLFSIERGRGNTRRAGQVQANAFFMLMACSAGLMILGYSLAGPLLRLFGASDVTWPYASRYFLIYLAGTPFQLISLGMNTFINAQGFARTGMMSVIVGAVVNIILDPIFIFALGMGVAGAALATIIAQCCSAVWVLHFLLGKRPPIRLRFHGEERAFAGSGTEAAAKAPLATATKAPTRWCPDLAIIKRITWLGLANFVFQLTNSIVQAVNNRMLYAYGGDLQVGVMTLVMTVRQVLYLPTLALSSATGPVSSFNYGARKPRRVLDSLRIMLVGSLAINALATILCFALPGPMLSLFTSDPSLVQAGIPALRIYFACFIFMAFQFSGQNGFTSTGRAKAATFFSLFRKVILVVPLAVFLPRIPLFGVYGVYWAETISQVVGASICYACMQLTLGRRMRRADRLMRSGLGEEAWGKEFI